MQQSYSDILTFSLYNGFSSKNTGSHNAIKNIFQPTPHLVKPNVSQTLHFVWQAFYFNM